MKYCMNPHGDEHNQSPSRRFQFRCGKNLKIQSSRDYLKEGTYTQIVTGLSRNMRLSKWMCLKRLARPHCMVEDGSVFCYFSFFSLAREELRESSPPQRRCASFHQRITEDDGSARALLSVGGSTRDREFHGVLATIGDLKQHFYGGRGHGHAELRRGERSGSSI